MCLWKRSGLFTSRDHGIKELWVQYNWYQIIWFILFCCCCCFSLSVLLFFSSQFSVPAVYQFHGYLHCGNFASPMTCNALTRGNLLVRSYRTLWQLGIWNNTRIDIDGTLSSDLYRVIIEHFWPYLKSVCSYCPWKSPIHLFVVFGRTHCPLWLNHRYRYWVCYKFYLKQYLLFGNCITVEWKSMRWWRLNFVLSLACGCFWSLYRKAVSSEIAIKVISDEPSMTRHQTTVAALNVWSCKYGTHLSSTGRLNLLWRNFVNKKLGSNLGITGLYRLSLSFLSVPDEPSSLLLPTSSSFCSQMHVHWRFCLSQ